MTTRRSTSKNSQRTGPRRFGLVRRHGQENPVERERGAALVEMALVLPFLVLMAFGMVEAGMGWRNAITVTSAARQGARVSSHLGVNPQADREGLLAVEAVMGSDMDQVELVIFYEATANGDMPAGCLATSISGKCNRYTPAMIGDLGNDASWGCSGHDSAWCGDADLVASGRVDNVRTADHLGVYIQFQHEYFTGILPGTAPVIKRQTIMRIEPKVD